MKYKYYELDKIMGDKYNPELEELKDVVPYAKMTTISVGANNG